MVDKEPETVGEIINNKLVTIDQVRSAVNRTLKGLQLERDGDDGLLVTTELSDELVEDLLDEIICRLAFDNRSDDGTRSTDNLPEMLEAEKPNP